MRTAFANKRISGLLSVVPETLIRFEDEVCNYNFPEKQTLRLQKVMGYKQHRIVKDTTSTSDLCCAGLDYILQNGWLNKNDIAAIVVADSFPDYFIPPVSSIIHGKFDLDSEVLCADISQGCCAFFWGLFEAFMLLERIHDDKKIVVFAADVLSKKVSKKDRNSFPLIGDGAGIAIVENCKDPSPIYSIIRNKGDIDGVLTIPAGGSRLQCSAKTAEMLNVEGDGNLRSLDNLTMKGSDVFNFVQTEIPPLIEDTLLYANLTKADIDYYFFHQPNKFMLRKLAEKLEIPFDKVPMNVVENFGNSSGACIPINITYNCAAELKAYTKNCCLSAFGSGLTWGAMVMPLGGLDFCEMFFSNL